jgi:hypothetical protein
MSLQIKTTSDLVKPENLKIKALIYSLPGCGKTEWLSTVPDIGIAACETGQGNGLLTIASKSIEFYTPENLTELEQLPKLFKDKAALGVDSLSEMNRTFIKDAALAMPRTRGDSAKRGKGVPELDDYMVMAELTRRYLRSILAIDKHIIITATEKYTGPDPETGQGEVLIGPELPGQMFTGSTAMFDMVLRLRTRTKLRDPKDAKSRYTERYFITGPDGQGTIAKCRNSVNGKSLLDPIEIFDLATGQGTFSYLLSKILDGYAANVSK